MLRCCAVALSASLLFASSFSAQAASVEAEWLMSGTAEVAIAAEAPAWAETANLLSLEERSERTTSVEPVVEQDAVFAALAPENFLDANEVETIALIREDLAAAAETTGSISSRVVFPDAEMTALPPETSPAARTSTETEVDFALTSLP